MKKNLFFLLLLAIIAMSCQKDIEQGSIAAAKTSEVTLSAETSIFDQAKPEANDDVYVKIQNFKTKLAKIEQGTMPESDNGTTVSEAIWNIEALLNSRYARASKPFLNLTSAKNTIRVTLNDDGTIDNAALLMAVNQTREQLNNQFQALSEPVKHVIAIDIRKKEPQVESGGSILLEVEGVYGLRRPLPSFGPDDYWHWGLGLGTCFGPPTQQPKDAAVKLGEKLNYRAFWETDVFYTDEEFSGLARYTNPNDVTPDDNIRDYIVFVQSPDLPNYNTYECLSPSDMNFYLNGARTVIANRKPPGKNFIDIDIHWDAVYLPNANLPVILHGGTIHYGVPHYINTPVGGQTAPCCL